MTAHWDDLLAANPGLADAVEGELGWHPIAGDAPWPSDDVIAAMDGAKSPLPQRLADGRWIAGLYKPPTCWVLLRDGDALTRWEMPPGWTTKDVHVAPSGRRALVYAQLRGRGVVGELDLADGALAIVEIGIDGHDKTEFANVWDASYVGDDDAIVALMDAGKDSFLALYQRTSAGWRETDNEKCNGYSARTSGDVIVVSREKDAMAFARVTGDPVDQLAKLGKLDKVIRVGEHPADTREVLYTSAFGGGDAKVLVGGAAAAAKKKAKKPKKGTTVVQRLPNAAIPRFANEEEQVAAFGEGWQRDLMMARGRSAGGVLIALPPGRTVLGRPGESPREVTTEGQWICRGAHPSAERALVVGNDAALAVLDLDTGEVGAPIADDVYTADYLALPDGEAAIVVVRKSARDAVEVHLEPLTGRLGEPALTIALDGAKVGVAGADLVLTRDGKKGQIIERWPVALDGDGLRCAMDTQLVLPGKRYGKVKVLARTIRGVGLLWSYGKPRFAFETRPSGL